MRGSTVLSLPLAEGKAIFALAKFHRERSNAVFLIALSPCGIIIKATHVCVAPLQKKPI
jgi:hypothetical protein